MLSEIEYQTLQFNQRTISQLEEIVEELKRNNIRIVSKYKLTPKTEQEKVYLSGRY